MSKLLHLLSFFVFALILLAGSATAQSTLRRGDQGADVQRLQEVLRSRGFNVTIDGRFGISTQQTIQEIQRQRGLIADGVVGPSTWLVLNEGQSAAPRPATAADRKLEVKSPRMFGDDVTAAQQLLVRAGYQLGIDGVYGTGMARAVRDFQARKGIRSDGRIGPDTWRALRG